MPDKKQKPPKITLYEGLNFKGRSKTFTEAHNNMVNAGFFDCASSVIVHGGVWVLYRDNNYSGDICVVIEGDRVNLLDGKKDTPDIKVYDFNNVLSSLKPLEFDCTEEPKITVFEGTFNSRKLDFTEDVKDMRWYKMNDKVSFIRVHSGAWVGYTHVDFRGHQTLFLPGEHRMTSSAGTFRNDQYSSFRALQIVPSHPLVVDKLVFHLDREENRQVTPVTIFSWSQTNNSTKPQKLSIKTDKIVTTEDSYEFTFEKGTKITAEVGFKAKVPLIGESEFKFGIEAHYKSGSTEGKKTAKQEKWSIHFPSEIPANSVILVESTITQGKIDVPFTAEVHQGDKKWTEKGTYRGTQYYGLSTVFTETPCKCK